MIAYILNHFRQWFCIHEFDAPKRITSGKWYRHQLQHPVYRDAFIPCERRDFISVCHCIKCDKRQVLEGYDTRDEQPLNAKPFPEKDAPTFTD